MSPWQRILLCIALSLLPAAALADDSARVRDALLQLGQGLQAREAARLRELLLPEVLITVTVVEPDAAPRFSFGREDFLQTYTSLWRFSSKENVEMMLRGLRQESDGDWSATADIRESMLLLGKAYRRESVVSCRVRKHSQRFLIESISMKTVIH